MKRARCLFAALACLALCAAARADRSSLADADGVLEAGDYEIKTAFERRAALQRSARRRCNWSAASAGAPNWRRPSSASGLTRRAKRPPASKPKPKVTPLRPMVYAAG